MDAHDPRVVLATLAQGGGHSLAALSRLIGRNAAYLQQFVTRGSPRVLAEADRRLLAAYLGIAESTLGGSPSPIGDGLARVQRIDAIAAAGPGAPLQADRQAGSELIDPALLARLAVRASDLSIIVARGESMQPTIFDGDDMLVDRSDRTVTRRGGIFVVRLDEGLMVKRAIARPGGFRLISDNPDFAVIDRADLDVVGRVVRLTRALK